GAVDEGDVGGSASHIEGDDALEAGETGGCGGADYAPGGAGEQGANRFAGRGGQGGDAAARLHDEDAGASGSGARGERDVASNVSTGAGFQVFQVTLHYWLQVGVDYCR